MNTQPITKRVESDGRTLLVHSIFYTIQGEGPFTGRPAVFVRLAGCNLQCPACDTEYTQGAQEMTVRAIVAEVTMETQIVPLVVITGGEPFRQNLEPLVLKLLNLGHEVQVETNGTLPPPSEHFAELCSTDTNKKFKCFVVCSPKAGRTHPKLHPIICAYKYVMEAGNVSQSDGLPIEALQHSAHPFVARPHEGFIGPVYLQPCDSKDEAQNKQNLYACIDSCMTHGYTLQLQVHKLIEME